MSEEREQPAVEVVPIESLTPDAANVVRRDERARRHLAASLRQFGPARSIVLDGKGIVRAGNGTLEAAQEAGVDEVLIVKPKPGQLVAVQRDDWSATEATGYAMADNRLAELKDYDEAARAEQLQSLRSDDFDLGAIGFTDSEVDELIERLAADIDGPLEIDVDGDHSASSEEEGDGEIPVSHVRMVQLFLNTDTFPEFQSMVDRLGEEYGTANATDTVMECLRRASDGREVPE